MSVHCDQLGREINLISTPTKIISVVPSQTELLFYLGLDRKIAGITKFCIHPAQEFRSVTKVGGTKQLDIAKIRALKPDLIIANKEENERSQLEELMQHFPVWISDIYNLADALEMIQGVGKLVGKEAAATILSNAINRNFNELSVIQQVKRVAYFIWRNPYMAAAKNTFIDSMLQKCGLMNAFDLQRYPEVDEAILQNANPDVILLSSEPYPFKERHIAELKAICPAATIKLVDGEMFSWYGSRLMEAPAYFKTLVNELIITD
jgi:ABC-type Fe3+-hydroxamate transport system substrate-binding protein